MCAINNFQLSGAGPECFRDVIQFHEDITFSSGAFQAYTTNLRPCMTGLGREWVPVFRDSRLLILSSD